MRATFDTEVVQMVLTLGREFPDASSQEIFEAVNHGRHTAGCGGTAMQNARTYLTQRLG